MDEICPHGDRLDSCVDCTIAPPSPTIHPPVLGIPRSWQAHYGGRCSAPECEGDIEVGDEIAVMTDGTYRHVICVTRWQTT